MSLTAVWDAAPFDREERAKARGQALSASANYRHLQLAREAALELASGGRVICADDVREALAAKFPGEDWGRRNWMGSCFAGDQWECKGWTRSKAPGSHANPLRIWKLKEGAK